MKTEKTRTEQIVDDASEIISLLFDLTVRAHREDDLEMKTRLQKAQNQMMDIRDVVDRFDTLAFQLARFNEKR